MGGSVIDIVPPILSLFLAITLNQRQRNGPLPITLSLIERKYFVPDYLIEYTDFLKNEATC